MKIVVGSIWVLSLLEVAARIAVAWDPLFRLIDQQDDSSWRLRWIHRPRASEIVYAFDLYHRTRGWSVKPGLHAVPLPGGKRLSTNSQGLRGEREFTYERRPGVPRILLLGDSFTFGDDVADDECYAGQLQALLPGCEVLNLGVHGYGHDQMLIYLREEGVKYHADLVILGFVHQDMFRNVLAFRDFAKPRFELRAGQLVLTHSPVPTPEAVLRSEFLRPKMWDLVNIAGQALRWKSGTTLEQSRAITAALLAEMSATIARAGAVPLFVYLPMADDLTQADAAAAREQFLFQVSRACGARCCSLASVLHADPAPAPSWFLPTQHWTPAAHRRIAAAMLERLGQEGLLAR
ncbi:MAG: SGNH/GDSL hydrolase family protein [Planctomycetota bacterium]